MTSYFQDGGHDVISPSATAWRVNTAFAVACTPAFGSS